MVKNTRRIARKPRRRPNPVREMVKEGQIFMAGVDRRVRSMHKHGRIVARGITRRSQANKTKPISHTTLKAHKGGKHKKTFFSP